jgi:hypothetical protein
VLPGPMGKHFPGPDGVEFLDIVEQQDPDPSRGRRGWVGGHVASLPASGGARKGTRWTATAAW